MRVLFPGKHENPDHTVIALATTMIKYLSRHRVAKYDSLFEHCQRASLHVEYLFSPAISLLYLLGLVQYLPKSDSFEWLRGGTE
ncbi:ABC-three component system middle component 8 [Arthrobacter sp. BPSS-3]|uniref:ABC-three component system middle component 8 n=1 Tax=Arthrobacter sp. BPSS-3 TaxID=3366580 RepID=UPI0037DC0A3C